MKKVIAVVMCFVTLLVTTACPGQTTIAALVNTLGGASAALAQMQGNPTLAAKLKTDTAAAVAAINNWKSGSPTDMAIEAIDIVIADLNLFPMIGPYAPLITLALTTAETIINILAPKASAQMKAKLPKYKVSGAKVPKNEAQFKKDWNAICAKDPALANAVLQ